MEFNLTKELLFLKIHILLNLKGKMINHTERPSFLHSTELIRQVAINFRTPVRPLHQFGAKDLFAALTGQSAIKAKESVSSLFPALELHLATEKFRDTKGFEKNPWVSRTAELFWDMSSRLLGGEQTEILEEINRQGRVGQVLSELILDFNSPQAYDMRTLTSGARRHYLEAVVPYSALREGPWTVQFQLSSLEKAARLLTGDPDLLDAENRIRAGQKNDDGLGDLRGMTPEARLLLDPTPGVARRLKAMETGIGRAQKDNLPQTRESVAFLRDGLRFLKAAAGIEGIR